MLAPNPAYGRGIFRRGVRIDVGERQVHVDLEDSNHAFRLRVGHDGRCITLIETEFVRHPFTTCPETGRYVAGLVGRPLGQATDVRRALETRLSCTHVTDMIGLALAHVHDVGLACLYEVAVDDERDGRTQARVTREGEPVHAWTVVRHAIAEPVELAGRPLLQGFHAWARESFSGSTLEAALVLQRGYFVAQARRYDPTPERDYPAKGDGLPDGVCYSYSKPAVERAERIEGSRREFTDDAAALLRFRR